MKPFILKDAHIQVTSICNRSCSYCYSPKLQNKPDLSFNQWKEIILALKEQGLERISISGGEPLLYYYIDDLMKYIKELHIKLYLSTNCDWYHLHKKAIHNYVDIIGIPLDGSNADIHDSTIGSYNFGHVIKAINSIYKYSNVKFTIGTVCNVHNFMDIKNIHDLLIPFSDRIHIWKIYQMIKFSKKNDSCNQIDKDLNVDNLTIENSKVNYMLYPNNRCLDNYFLINPYGEVLIPSKQKDDFIGVSQGNVLTQNIQELINHGA